MCALMVTITKPSYVALIITACLLVTSIVIIFNTSNVRAGTPVSGSIGTDSTWTLAEHPYWVEGNIRILPGVTLTIEPGVEVRFNGSYSFIIDGTLNAIGMLGSRISFTSNLTSLAKWDSIQVNPSGRAVIKYVDITHGGGGNPPILLLSDNNNLDNINISNCSGEIQLTDSNNNMISNCTLLKNRIWLEGSSYNTIENNIVSKSKNLGIWLKKDSSYNIIQNNNISYCGEW